MLRSRALPESFDMTQALHSPFGTAPPTMGTPMPSPAAYSQFGNDAGGGVRPLTLDTLRRVPEYEQFGQPQYTSPSGITPAMGQFAFTPPQSATETISPGSAVSDMSPFGFQPRAPQESPRRPPFTGPMGSGQPGYGSHPTQMPRLHMHDRFNRPIGETASSPLRTSMSYSALGSGSVSQHQPTERAASFSEHTSHPSDRSNQQRSLTNPTSSGSGSYGLGFTCKLKVHDTSMEQALTYDRHRPDVLVSEHGAESTNASTAYAAEQYRISHNWIPRVSPRQPFSWSIRIFLPIIHRLRGAANASVWQLQPALQPSLQYPLSTASGFHSTISAAASATTASAATPIAGCLWRSAKPVAVLDLTRQFKRGPVPR